MTSKPTSPLRALACIATCGAAAALFAAPFVSAPQLVVPDDVISLAGLTELSLSVSDLPVEVDAETLTHEQLTQVLRKQLTEAGLEVKEDDAFPLLDVKLLVNTDAAVPDGIAFCFRLRLSQDCQVNRLARELTVPTYDHVVFGLLHREDLATSLEEAAIILIREFASEVRIGSAGSKDAN